MHVAIYELEAHQAYPGESENFYCFDDIMMNLLSTFSVNIRMIIACLQNIDLHVQVSTCIVMSNVNLVLD